jgi:nitroreductase
MDKKSAIKDIIDFRFACKVFDKDRKIPKEDLEFILENARLAPSSFGMEGWKVLVISREKLKSQLTPLCWNQKQIETSSHLLVILSAIESLKPSSGTPQKMLKRRDLEPQILDKYIKVYSDYFTNITKNESDIFGWSARQSYILATYLMLLASSLGIDSCPIEGFEQRAVEELLDINTKEFRVSLLLPLGYRTTPQSKRLRKSLDEVVEFLD